MILKNKTVFITGAAKRIGRAIALDLAGQGAHILIHYRRSSKDALSLQKQIKELGAKADLIQADFTLKKNQSVEKLVSDILKKIKKKASRVDVLINNASEFYPSRLKKIKESDWDHLMSVNLKVPFFLAYEIGKQMVRRKRGKIINFVDWTISRPNPDYLPYIISKSGLLTATHGLARAFAPHVQVNSIAPGPILPPPGKTKSQATGAVKRTLLKRFGNVEDIVNTVRYLLEGSDYVTGTCVPVEGGCLLGEV